MKDFYGMSEREKKDLLTDLLKSVLTLKDNPTEVRLLYIRIENTIKQVFPDSLAKKYIEQIHKVKFYPIQYTSYGTPIDPKPDFDKSQKKWIRIINNMIQKIEKPTTNNNMKSTLENEIRNIEILAEEYKRKRSQRFVAQLCKEAFFSWQKAMQEFLLKYFGETDNKYIEIKQITINKTTYTLSEFFDKFQPICTEMFYEMRNTNTEPMRKKYNTKSKKVFIVHGHDTYMRTNVKKYVKSLGLEPIILSEKANRNMTILEKLQNEAKDIGFAVVLYTPCDEGREFGSNTGLTRRARENVVLELGYFSALLPKKVAILLKRPKNVSFDFPNDFKGIGYIEYPKPDWKEKLKEEFKAAHILS